MSMKKNIMIDGQEVAFKASAAIPRIYRMRFHRDIYKDLRDLELAMVPESFRTDVLKESLDDNSVLVESANVETANFALLFEFDGDVKKIRHVLYNCSAARPNIESATNEEEIEVQTETLAITAAPLANGYVKARTGDSTTDTVYTGWYTAVYLPEVTPDTSGTQQSGQQGTDDETGGETL